MLKTAPQCPRCGGRNEPGTSVCGFCASPLASGTTRMSATWRPRGWALAALGLVLLSLLALASYLATHSLT